MITAENGLGQRLGAGFNYLFHSTQRFDRQLPEYIDVIKQGIINTARGIEKGPSVLSAEEKLKLNGQVIKIPAGGALTDAETQSGSHYKIDLIRDLLVQGKRVIVRAHGQIDPDILHQRGIVINGSDGVLVQNRQRLGHLSWQDLVKTDASNNIAHQGDRQCGGLGMGNGHPGILSAIRGIDNLRRQLSDNDLIDYGVEIPGGLVIRPERFTVELDRALLIQMGLITPGSSEEDQQLKNAVMVTCIDERTGPSQQIPKPEEKIIEEQLYLFFPDKEGNVIPGSSFPHQATAMGIFDVNDPEHRLLAVAADKMRLRHDWHNHTGGMVQVLTDFSKLTTGERQQMLINFARLNYVLGVEGCFANPSSDCAVDSPSGSLPIPNMDFLTYLTNFGKNNPLLPIIVPNGLLTQDEIKFFKKQNISIITL